MGAILKADVLLTPERWGKALTVLTGEDDERVSKRAAAEKAGVTTRILDQWVARSREKRVEDEEWIHDIADQFDDAGLRQAQVLEDKMWEMAHRGVRKEVTKTSMLKDSELPVTDTTTTYAEDPALVGRLLEVRDRRYRKADAGKINLNLNLEDLYRRFQAVGKIARARRLADQGVIEIQGEEVMDTEVVEDEWENA